MDTLNNFATDANIFYMGLPFLTTAENTYFITPEIFDEIKHIKKNLDALDLLMITKKVIIIEPSRHKILEVKKKEIEVGRVCLSTADHSIIALALELNFPLLTTDFSLANVAKHLSLKIVTPGKKSFSLRTSRKYCSICKKFFSNISEYCDCCGNQLINRRKS